MIFTGVILALIALVCSIALHLSKPSSYSRGILVRIIPMLLIAIILWAIPAKVRLKVLKTTPEVERVIPDNKRNT